MARILVTSALPYINGIKHLGNLAGSMLPADVYSRFQRARGHEVLSVCATDEHGTPAELATAEDHVLGALGVASGIATAARRFVMGPLAEIAPDWPWPGALTASALAEHATVGLDASP